MTDRDFATDPSPRILAAEQRREFRGLLARSSFGSPGALAVQKYGRIAMGSGETMTDDERAAMGEHMAELEAELRSGRRQAGHEENQQ